MDGENAALCKRLSSILKSGRVRGTEEDDRTDEIINQRRVSFARKFSVKPFTYDAEANNTVWDATYEEAAIQSDQSTSHTTADSAVHMSIEVSNICQLHPQRVQSSSRADPLMNMTCVNMDEDIEIEADDIQFAPVRQTRIHNPKFAIFEDDSAKLKTADDKPIQSSFINPSLIKENTQTNIDDVLLGNEQGKEDNMQLESNIEFNKTTSTLDALKQCNYNLPMDIVNNVKDKDFDLNSSSPGTAMNFTIHEVKKIITNKPTEKITVPQKSNQNIEEDGDMEFTTDILTKPLQENLPRKEVESDDCGHNVMDVTMNFVPSNRKLIVDCDMEFTTVIPKNVLKVKFNPEFNHNVEDGDMEFTKNIPAVLLEKLRLKMQAENKNNHSSLDDLIIDDDASAPLNCSQQYKISDKENMDLTMISKNVRCSGKDNKSSFGLKTDSNEEDRTQEVRPQIVCSYAEQQDIVQCVSKGRDSSCQFDASFHTNPTSEVDDTQYLINYKSRICKGSPLSTSATGKGAVTNFQICEEESLQNKLPVLKIAEIPNVLTVPENLSQADQSCKKKAIPITAEVEEDRIPNIISNDDNCFELSAAVNDRTKIDEIASLTNQHEIPQTESFPVQKNDLNTANFFDKLTNHSEIDVFKPSSKNNTRCSFFESMEIGTPYISVTEESNDKIIDQMDESLLKVMPKVHCYETDKIIFASESSCSLELEEAFGNLRRSLYGIAEGHVPTHMSTHEILAKTLYNPEETLCQEDIPILDDSHVDIQFDSAELAENLSASTIAFYNSNEDSKIGDSSNDNIQASSASPIVHTPEDQASNNRIPLSYLPNISPNCSIDQLYDLLGWSADDMPRGVPLPPRISAEEKEKQRAMRQMMRLAEERGFERLAQSCRKMMETVAQIDRESAIRSAEDLARSQGRTLRPQTVEEWLKHQRKTQSTLWSLKSLTNDNCVVSSRFTQFDLEIEPDSFVITSTTVQNIADSKSVTNLSQLIRKLFVDKTQKSQIQSAIGTKYNLRTFLEYLQMKLDDVVIIEREFLKIFCKLLVEARLSFDDNLILQYLLIGRSRWLIKINCFDINNLSQNSICEMITLTGDFRVPEKEIKKIARKCPRGLPFLSSFVDGVYEFRNMRERKHCLVLNELLNKMETKI